MARTEPEGEAGSLDPSAAETWVEVMVRVADHLNDLVALVDPDGALFYVNEPGRRMLRIEPLSAGPRSLIELVADDHHDALEAGSATARAEGSWSGTLDFASPVLDRIPTRVTLVRLAPDDRPGALGVVARDITTERDIIRTLRDRAFFDRLTGLPHRTLFLDRLDLLLRRSGDRPGATVLLVAPNRFRERITRYDQGTADAVLRAMARRLNALASGERTIHRWNGDEFVVLAEDVPDEATARRLADDLLGCFAEPFRVGVQDLFLTASIGATVASRATTADEVLREVEGAAQLARMANGTVRVHDDTARAAQARRADIEDALRGAVDRDEFTLHYQPEVELRSDRIVGCEALLRWHHPELGAVSPAEFVPIAESSGTILDIGRWVLRAGMAQAARWRQRWPDRELLLALNVSAGQFARDDFTEEVADLMAQTAADPGAICLEITESMMLDDVDETARKLAVLHDRGLTVAIDDFGTGYSSLSYLRRFPADILKVDRSFVAGLGHDPEDSAIVQAVVHMGKALGVRTLAEGVETAHHLIELRELDCDLAQGYHFAAPMPAERFERLIDAGDGWRHLDGD